MRSPAASEAPALALPQAAARALEASRALERVRPAFVLAALVAAQWLALLALALTVRHNGWLYFEGGDELWHYTSGWLLAHGQLPPAPVAYGWATTLLPFAALAGPSLPAALPAIVLFQTLVLLPAALLAVHGIGERIGGRLFGYWCAIVWIALPFLGILYTLPGYHQKYTELTLPQALGLSAMSDFPSIAFLLVGAFFVVRLLDRPSLLDGVAAGAAMSASLAIKPSNVLVLLPAALALLLRRRYRDLLVGGAALVPFALVLALWKQRGLGSLPAFGLTPPAAREAVGVGGVFTPVTRYLDFDWHHLNDNLLGIQEHFWSLRLLEVLVVVGAFALARRSAALALFLGGWFAVFLAAKGTYRFSSVDDASFLRLLLPAAPAFVLLLAAIPLLLPRAGARIAERGRALPLPLPRRRLGAAAALALVAFAVYPAAVIASASKLRGPDPDGLVLGSTFVAVDAGLAPRASARLGSVTLRWSPERAGGTALFYRVVRSRGGGPDVTCERAHDEPDSCSPTGDTVAVVRGGSYVDRPGPGRWTYRVGVSGNWLDDQSQGDVFAFSRPVVVDVR